ncbi:MAG: hypothetical protein AB7S38_16980 [Vulcanimicrobiota bacterium]
MRVQLLQAPRQTAVDGQRHLANPRFEHFVGLVLTHEVDRSIHVKGEQG